MHSDLDAGGLPPQKGAEEGDSARLSEEALLPDLQTACSYGAEHTEEWSDVSFTLDDPVKLRVYFSGNLEVHDSALRRQMVHPERLEVRRAPRSQLRSGASSRSWHPG